MNTFEKIWEIWKLTVLGAGLLSLGMMWVVFPVMVFTSIIENNMTMLIISLVLSYLQFKAIYEINKEDNERN